MINKICVTGAGTMGSGIALCAAQNGFDTILFDTNETVLANAETGINKNLNTLLEKNKISESDKSSILNRLVFTNRIEDCVAPLIIEAIVEKPEIKISLFNQLAEINEPSTIFASNTSSLSINLLQKGISNPDRVAGLHFFNPAQIMKLVEVVKAENTSTEVIDTLMQLCITLKKTPVLCIDAPGFIVNRVARHYYLEAMKLVELELATIETVDEIMEASGFKMGPFKLMDLIGNDINLAVTTSLYEAFNHEHRFKPSILQINKVKNNELGRKTGQGFYGYTK
jgi:3-hydroxybutyryl-CoA dehydrogenase